MAEHRSFEDYRVAFTKLLWASPIANAAGLLAVLQLLGNVPDPDYAFNALRSTIIALGAGGSMGLAAILFAQMGLMDDMMFQRRLSALKESPDEAERAALTRKANLSVTSRMYMEFTATALNFFSLSALVWAGLFAFQAADEGRIQPRPGQVTQADVFRSVTDLLAAVADNPLPETVSSPPEKADR